MVLDPANEAIIACRRHRAGRLSVERLGWKWDGLNCWLFGGGLVCELTEQRVKIGKIEGFLDRCDPPIGGIGIAGLARTGDRRID